MMTLFSFLKPYRLSCFFIVLIFLADVGGSLLIPAITANMITSQSVEKDWTASGT